MIKTPRFHCRGRRFDPWLGGLKSHTTARRGQKKREGGREGGKEEGREEGRIVL